MPLFWKTASSSSRRWYGSQLLEIIHRFTHLYRTYYADDEHSHLVEFSRGAIDCLVTCHKISQGIDIRLLKTVVLFSAARAKLETIQRIGRCLRIDPSNPGKRARVINFVRPDRDDEGFPNADQERCDWLGAVALPEGGCEWRLIRSLRTLFGPLSPMQGSRPPWRNGCWPTDSRT